MPRLMRSRVWSACALAVVTAAAASGAAVGDAGPTGAAPRTIRASEGSAQSQPAAPTREPELNPAVRDSVRAALSRVREHDPLPERAPSHQPRDRHRNPAKVAVQYAANGIPSIALQAYHDAARNIDAELPACHLSWSLLAGIGRIESNHGRYGGAWSGPDGEVNPAILGPALTGANGTARILDTDNGEYDGDRMLDRAVGPMQFLPGTWAVVGADGNGDGTADPNNIFDAALGAAEYLCAGDRDLQRPADLHAAVFSYNHSDAYVAEVLGLASLYREGRTPTVPSVTSNPAQSGSAHPAEREPERSGHQPAADGLEPPPDRPSPEPSHAPQASDAPTAGPSDPPASAPSDPPASSDPTDSPTSNPPTSDPPTSNPPTSDPPTSNPPTSDPPTSNPPTSDPPTSDPPTSDPPTPGAPKRPEKPALQDSDDPVIATTLTPTFTAAVKGSKEKLLYSFELWPADHDADAATALRGSTYRAGPGRPAHWTIPVEHALADGQNYSLRVRATDVAGTSRWSEWLDFTVTLTSGPPTSDPPTGTPTGPPSSGTPTDPPSSDTPTPSPTPSAESTATGAS